MPSFDELRRAKARGFNLTVLMVQSYLSEHGFQPIGRIADACEVSIRSVERAIVALKAHGLLEGKLSSETSKTSHDHVTHGSHLKGAAADLTALGAKADATASSCPLTNALLGYEVLPWCVDALVVKVDPAVLTRQLAFHAHRLATGFVFKGHPARYLFRACLNDYQPPQDFHATQHRKHEGLEKPASRRFEAPVRPPAAVAAPRQPEQQASLTREGALTIVRLGLRSRLPRVQEEALRLAAEWNIDLRGMAGVG